MNFETEKILATLEIVTEQYLNFHLPNNENSCLEPFFWDITQKGDFSLLNLGHDRGWITLTDIDVAVKSWQALERRGYLNPDDDPGDYEDEDIISFELADERAKIYQTLADTIQKNIYNIEVFKFSQIPAYSFYVVLGQNQENNWFCFSQTVARETKLEGEIKCYNIPDLTMQSSLDSNTAKLKDEFQQIINQLQPISIYGYYGGGYDYRFNHYLVTGIANSKEKALLIALHQAGMLDIARFYEFSPEALSWRWDKDEMVNFYPKYQKINQFLTQNLSDLRMIRCSFWNRECIYVIGQTNAGDVTGIYIESDFDYNP
ncbi:nuclease A inhibitor family protein [Nostoc sp. DedSLP04]|uniref:nuclease A inhibitor family protein n=1 Tax=Nostoc sp. DedSLP04 TaxID=3075401 RepID=UPI002AD26C76|nr:nuclease A inhibitor family protein [Nostoc sp. DedSLP04]MDZ8030395.1 nuclease A inhibitor family protein [Nostoc sp. DedSLP04]